MKRFSKSSISRWVSTVSCLVAFQFTGHAQLHPSVENRLLSPADTGSAPEKRSDNSASMTSSGGPSNSLDGYTIQQSSFGFIFSAGAPDFLYGDQITPPLLAADGTTELTPEQAAAYWRTEPVKPGETFKIGGNFNQTPVPANEIPRFHFSPHADAVFASETGNIQITWVTAETDANANFSILTRPYNIGSGTTRLVRNHYWTDGTYTAPPVNIPTSIVQEIEIIYNQRMPETVPNEEIVQPNGTYAGVLPNTTFWYDTQQKQLRSYNKEGKVLIEYLGAPRGDTGSGLREHLGIEVVDVRRELRTQEVTTRIGEQILPSSLDDVSLLAAPVNLFTGEVSYVQPHITDNRQVYYAVRENNIPDRVQFYWLETGEHTLRWPVLLNSYRLEWPNDIADYEGTFVRPDLTENSDNTHIVLPTTSTPQLIYQDDANGQEASLDIKQNFFVTLGEDGTNRSLIRFQDGNNFWYVRIYSATESALGDRDATEGIDLTANVEVGQRIPAPPGADSIAGYIQPQSGTAYNPTAYIQPYADGGIEDAERGAIIPVNALPGNDTLRVWWFKRISPPAHLTDTFPPIYTPSIVGQYQITWPTNPSKIILASNAGSDDLPTEQTTAEIYTQNDPSAIGYNPNEEHAIMLAGRAYALRDDLNIPESSEPFVLISYTAEDERPAMRAFKVERESADHTFNYSATAGTILQAPMPLPILPVPINENGISANTETTPANLDPVTNGPAAQNLAHYDAFTFQDRKGNTWLYRGPHSGTQDPLNPSHLTMQFYYKTQESFAFPNSSGQNQAPEIGTIVPFLRPLDNSGNPIGDPITGTPVEINFEPNWPEITPRLSFAETLTLPKFGLPQVRGAKSAQLIYQQSIAKDFAAAQPSAVLYDPTISRISTFENATTGGITLIDTPSSIDTTDARGKIYFQQLPSHLQERVFIDPSLGTNGALVFQGQFFDEPAGEDYLLPNIFSPEDLTLVQNLCDPSDPLKTNWDTLVNNLHLQFTTKTSVAGTDQFEDTNLNDFLANLSVTSIIGKQIFQETPPTAPKEILSPDQPVDSYAITAVGGGSGYVVLVTGNGSAFTPSEEPVQMHIFRVGEKLYTGELKPLVAANPLSENVTIQHTGDFAGRPDQFEFQWMKAPPVNGQPAQVYEFNHQMFPIGNPSFAIADNNAQAGFPADWDDRADGNQSGHPIGQATYLLSELSTTGSDLPGLNKSGIVLRQRLTTNIDFSSLFNGTQEVSDLYISIKKDQADGLTIFLDGNEVITYGNPNRLDTVAEQAPPFDISFPLTTDDYVPFRIPGRFLNPTAPTTLEIQFTGSAENGIDARQAIFDLRLATTTRDDLSNTSYIPVDNSPVTGKNRHLVAGSGVDTLGDNYFIMRYRPLSGHTLYPPAGYTTTQDGWSDWTSPALIEGWIKRVLAGINPFNQKITDFFENAVNTDVSLISQAGSRWEGDIALNLDAVQDAGLIEIYETVLKRGIDLSINGSPSINYGPANDALLLAAGYLNDLYMALGNEAFADASNPTVAYDAQTIGTIADPSIAGTFEETFNNTATARFAFQGQVPNLIEEELSLLRGRDDFLAPGITVAPAYNRLFWNYTRGIDAGEVIYALNYNISEQDDVTADGRIDAVDAQRMFPQAHGDAYGHYLTAVKNYYRLLTDPDFTWGTRVEAVNVLGQPITIDYLDERKFAAAAAATSRTANQILSLERRRAFRNASAIGWEALNDQRENSSTNRTRHWGVADWASRAGQGTYFNWIVGNAILPELDTVNEGIQKIDRTTVPELAELAALAQSIQRQIDAANLRENPLNLTNDSLLFDISPSELSNGKTHFEQIYQRATQALANANEVFSRASSSTRLLRSLENQNQNLGQVIADQERSYSNQLIDLYGMPYAGDLGPGKTYAQGYEGPDLYNFYKIDRPFEIFSKQQLFSYSDTDSDGNNVNTVNLLTKDDNLIATLGSPSTVTNDLAAIALKPFVTEITDLTGALETSSQVRYQIREDMGPYQIVTGLGDRTTVGAIQEQLASVRLAEERLYAGLAAMNSARETLDASYADIQLDLINQNEISKLNFALEAEGLATRILEKVFEEIRSKFAAAEETLEESIFAVKEALPQVAGVSNDITSGARAALLAGKISAEIPITFGEEATDTAQKAVEIGFEILSSTLNKQIGAREKDNDTRALITDLLAQYTTARGKLREVDALFVAYRREVQQYQKLLAAGETLLRERETFRKRAAATIQGYRTRDVAFRAFRTEALEEYQTLLDWASRYTFLAAQAYDYETGLLGSQEGQQFLGDIISSRAIGIISENGQPTFGGSNTGDPGLSGLLSRMKADWDVVEGRLGFNNPDTDGTTVSLRRELYRIPDGPEGDVAWQQVLESLVSQNLLADAEVAAHAMQLTGNNIVSQPGLLIPFSTTIQEGQNLFGRPLAAGDHAFSTTNFATKIHSAGVVFEGYKGIDPCTQCASGAEDPSHNHDDALSATPYVFLLPTGLDTMRTPPLGDTNILRSWKVHDHALPLPFNIGANDNHDGNYYVGSDSLSEQFQFPRKHNAFRAVSRTDFFHTPQSADYTSSRLVGRSIWNSQWKLVIPAQTLLADEQEGLARFIRSVKDIKIHFKTYSYSGN